MIESFLFGEEEGSFDFGTVELVVSKTLAGIHLIKLFILDPSHLPAFIILKSIQLVTEWSIKDQKNLGNKINLRKDRKTLALSMLNFEIFVCASPWT